MDTENKENEEIQNELEVSESVENVSNVSEESVEATESDVVKSEVVETAVVESEPSNKEEPEVSKKEDKKSKKEKKESPKAKKEKKKFEAKNLRMNVSETYEKVQSNVPLYIGVAIASFFVVVMAAVATFFLTVKGPEQVLVPNVVGKQLEDALLEMQVKELYPKINLRYSDVPGDEGSILEQNPPAGAIVKGYSRVSLVVSRGVVVDKLGNYVGQNYDDVVLSLQTLFAGQTKPLIVLGTPQYKPDLSDAGTILEQDPPEGTEISEPVTVKLVVSRGPNYENTKAPYVIGQSINDLLQTIARSKIVFDITSHPAADGEKAGTVVSQQTFDSEFVPNYTRVTVEMALEEKPSKKDDNVQGIFIDNVANYPYPVPMKLVAVPSEGDSYTILSFVHPGGQVTIPYSVPKGTTLVLYIVDKESSKQQIN